MPEQSEDPQTLLPRLLSRDVAPTGAQKMRSVDCRLSPTSPRVSSSLGNSGREATPVESSSRGFYQKCRKVGLQRNVKNDTDTDIDIDIDII